MKNTMAQNILKIALLTLPVLGGGLLVGCSTAPKQESAGQYLDSSVVTTKVKAALLADSEVKSLPITVKTYKNVVQLSGFVNNSSQAARAVQITRQVPGVEEVRNALLIKKR